MSKKALVYTHTKIPNYGANLQALSTSLILKKFNYDPCFLDIMPTGLKTHYNSTTSQRQRNLHEEFAQKELNLTEEFNHIGDINFFLKNNLFDIHVTGSDAVFKLDLKSSNSRWDQHYPNPFWLNNVNSKKISFSPSAMGTDFKKEIEKKDRQKFSENLMEFDALTCRDAWTKKQLEYFGANPIQTLDPVFLLPYLDDRFKTKRNNDKYIVISIPLYLQNTWKKELISFFKTKNYNVIDIGTPENNDMHLNPIEWYKIIAESSGYIGTRFHPLVICLSNNVPLFSLDQYARTCFSRNRSKSYLILKDFKKQSYHSTKIGYRLLKIEDVYLKILEQDRQKTSNDIVKNRISKTISLFGSILESMDDKKQ